MNTHPEEAAVQTHTRSVSEVCVHLLVLCPDCGHSAPRCHALVLAADPVGSVLSEEEALVSLRRPPGGTRPALSLCTGTDGTD